MKAKNKSFLENSLIIFDLKKHSNQRLAKLLHVRHCLHQSPNNLSVPLVFAPLRFTSNHLDENVIPNRKSTRLSPPKEKIPTNGKKIQLDNPMPQQNPKGKQVASSQPKRIYLPRQIENRIQWKPTWNKLVIFSFHFLFTASYGRKISTNGSG